MFIENINKAQLLKPLQTIAGIVERKQALPILANVLIQKTGSSYKFTSTDLEIQIAMLLETDQAASDMAVTLGAKKLQDILRVLPDDNRVSLDIQDSRVLVKSGKSKFVVQTLPAEDFPQFAKPQGTAKTITLEQKQLKSLLGAVQYSMAQQDVRYYLNGVLLVVDGNQLKAVATDGHRLAYRNIELADSHPKHEVILPRKTIVELFKLLQDGDDATITLELSENQIKAAFSDVTISSKIIDGKFPDYEKVIPKYSNHLTLERLVILQALQRVAILSNEKFRGVRCVLTEKNLRIISNNSEQEEAQEDIETDYHDQALDIGFNVNYLIEGLNNIAAENVVFSFGDSNSSILITIPDDKNFSYVVMPMRI
jgi:DNA polymerase-3 subunit beta